MTTLRDKRAKRLKIKMTPLGKCAHATFMTAVSVYDQESPNFTAKCWNRVAEAVIRANQSIKFFEPRDK